LLGGAASPAALLAYFRRSFEWLRLARAASVPVTTHGAAGKDHSTLNNDLGLPNDKPTQEMFAFLSQVSRRQ
jgi:hypothetical protein